MEQITLSQIALEAKYATYLRSKFAEKLFYDASRRLLLVLDLRLNFNENITKRVCMILINVTDKLFLAQITLKYKFAKFGSFDAANFKSSIRQ